MFVAVALVVLPLVFIVMLQATKVCAAVPVVWLYVGHFRIVWLAMAFPVPSPLATITSAP